MGVEGRTRLRRPLDAWFVVGGVIVVLLCSAVALNGVPEWERAIFEAINGTVASTRRAAVLLPGDAGSRGGIDSDETLA